MKLLYAGKKEALEKNILKQRSESFVRGTITVLKHAITFTNYVVIPYGIEIISGYVKCKVNGKQKLCSTYIFLMTILHMKNTLTFSVSQSYFCDTSQIDHPHSGLHVPNAKHRY